MDEDFMDPIEYEDREVMTIGNVAIYYDHKQSSEDGLPPAYLLCGDGFGYDNSPPFGSPAEAIGYLKEIGYNGEVWVSPDSGTGRELLFQSIEEAEALIDLSRIF